MTVDESVGNRFRERTAYMKTWKPDSTPSNRDRLELYALHKQAISGDAPDHLACPTAADRSKFNAWKSKRGLTNAQAMQEYLLEADRQVRVYGNVNHAMLPDSNNNQTPPNTPYTQQPRGLAAIPLLCAAAAESRSAYLVRLSQTTTPWWSRQEALCATPHSLGALPETALLQLASLVEYTSLHAPAFLPTPVLQSFLWPLHNVLLALWMGLIIILTATGAVWDLLTTLLWGTRRTGHSLTGIWKDAILFSRQSVQVLCESHQPLSARVMGLLLTPYPLVVQLSQMIANPQIQSLLYAITFLSIGWYWFVFLPIWLFAGLLWVAACAGGCFALIEWAGV